MKIVLSFIVVLAFVSSCTNNTSPIDKIFAGERFDTLINYSDPICLQYKGKPLLTPGQNIKQLNKELSFRYDPNGKYEKSYQFVTDYLSLDDYYSADLKTGQITGALYFTADKKGRIFRFSGAWEIQGDMVDTAGMEIIAVMEKYFPCLPPDFFKVKREFVLPHKNYDEVFQFKFLPYDTATHKEAYWLLGYNIILKR